MDSKTINKLIRSEVWPILRDQGFTVFESRSAFAYNPPFVNVVSFQSFNSHLAAGLGCTTYSFTPRLGVFVIGSPGENRVNRDKACRLRPYEYECAFRGELRKRTPVDGFARDEIFSIDPTGATTAHCFEELKCLCREVVPDWFKRNNNLDNMIARMRHDDEFNTSFYLEASGLPGSYNWNRLRSVLLLSKHRHLQTRQSANEALNSIDRTIGKIFDFSTIQSRPSSEERYALEMRELWDQFGNYRPIARSSRASVTGDGNLDGAAWSLAATHPRGPAATSDRSESIVLRKHFWPILKDLGFSEFTDRLAHRFSDDVVEVIELLPMDKAELKACSLPDNFFRIGVGVFWPMLREEGLCRTNRFGEARPTTNQCHISNWLVPEIAAHKDARTAFGAPEEAIGILTGSTKIWLDTLRHFDSALSLLRRNDWELFWSDPMMRGLGAVSSSRRLVYLSYLKQVLGRTAEAEADFRLAEENLATSYPRHLHSRYEDWMIQIKARIFGAE